MAHQKPAFTDEEALEVLELVDCGWTREQIGRHLGRSKNAIIGLTNRIRYDLARTRCECTKPENKDGGMPPGWWRR